jgi:Tfp pilus assembly protein PilO
MRLAIYLVAIVFILGLALAKNLDNKAAYLKRLKEELGKISQECLPLEEMEDRLKVLEKYSGQRLSSLDLIYTVNQALPQGVTLSSFIYEEPNELVLRGAAPELSYVFRLVADLQKAVSLRKFNVKVRYATKKRVVSGEIVDFEIACLKGK